ncbi:MAG: ABC transporter ATP-binding protein/permease [Oscillospiraceae bacterium]|nr:ABC transporter ATP-binding protein/permease [Oscillospiraceae bacterium]
MLVLKNIVKDYVTGDTTVRALKGININFRKSEFVSILGPSGCGKTTMLNIIGGLDRYTSGDLLINGKSTKSFQDSDWDTYRNHSIGFVFQSYNLIPHQTILSNVELALTLSGVSKKERKQRAIEALTRVGLKEHIYKRPNQLSGGQMQRVAIARSLINDPDILLADEPTGALDSETSIQIMELLKEISKDKLIIMVTHNPDLAYQYSNRIIKCLDGKVIDDSNPYEPTEQDLEAEKNDALNAQSKGKKSMSLASAFSLSFNNLRTKSTRTFLTAFAGSIGIIGIALVLALSSGIQNYIDTVQEDMLLAYPMIVEKQTMDLNSLMTTFTGMSTEMMEGKEFDEDTIYVNNAFNDMVNAFISEATSNNLENFKNYVEDNRGEFNKYCNDIQYVYSTPLNIYKADTSEGPVKVNPSSLMDSMGQMSGMGDMGDMSSMMSSMTQSFSVWTQLIGDDKLIDRQYDVIAGRMPEKFNEVVLIVDGNNQINELVLYAMGLKDQEEFSQNIMSALMSGENLENTDIQEYSTDQILNMKFKLVLNADYYVKDSKTGLWSDNSSNKYYVKELVDNGTEISIVGILRPGEENTLAMTSGGIGYTRELMDYAINETANCQVVKEQLEHPDADVITGLEFSNLTVNDFDLADVDLSLINFDYLDITPFLSMAEGMDMADINFMDMSSMFGFDDMSELQKKLMEGFLNDEQVLAIKQAYIDSIVATCSYDNTMDKLGYSIGRSPSAINFYPKSFESKEGLNELIEYYNDKVTEDGHPECVIQVTDLIGMVMSSVTTILNVVTYVLVAFIAISLVVSSIMIGIITYISVLERTKEIGILRAMGASKKDVGRVFNAETAVVGFAAGLIGILCTLVLEIPLNLLLKYVAHIPAQASLPILGGIILIVISVGLTLIAGLIPSRIASKKDPVEALRTE